jgi:hypothetical protein
MPLSPSVPISHGGAPDEAHRVAAGFEALLFESVLRPLAKPLGFFGEVALGALAGAAADQAHDALRERIEAIVDAAR